MKYQLDPTQERSPDCSHQKFAKPVEVTERVCPQCVAQGDTWVHLRVCLLCGQVGCCDNSKNRHATQHYDDEGHPLIMSIEPGEHWAYCYVEKKYL